jgi:hypothetical protein
MESTTKRATNPRRRLFCLAKSWEQQAKAIDIFAKLSNVHALSAIGEGYAACAAELRHFLEEDDK